MPRRDGDGVLTCVGILEVRAWEYCPPPSAGPEKIKQFDIKCAIYGIDGIVVLTSLMCYFYE